MDEIDKLIDSNLEIIFNQENQQMFYHDFVDKEGMKLNNRFLGKKFADEMVSRGLIRLQSQLCIIEQKGRDVYKEGGWIKYLQNNKKRNEELREKIKEKQDLELEKSKVDLELAKKILKEYPKTKWSARIGLIIAILLVIIDIVKFILENIKNE